MNIKFTTDIIALICTGVITLIFFIAGIFKVLDYIIIKAILFGLLISLILLVLAKGKWSLEKNKE